MKVKEFVGVLEFKVEMVIFMMFNLLNDRYKYFFECVYGLFKVLSFVYKINKINGFSECLIIVDCIFDFWWDSVSVNYCKEDYIDDLCVLFYFFVYKEFIIINCIVEVLLVVYWVNDCQIGDWMNVDGNLMCVKMFKNGNVYFEIYFDVVWKLNEVLVYSMFVVIFVLCCIVLKIWVLKQFGLIQKMIFVLVCIVFCDG